MINEQQQRSSTEKSGENSHQRSPEVTISALNFPKAEKVATKPPAHFVYNKETMLQIYLEPASKIRPSYLSEEFDECATNESGASAKLWKPDLWIQSLWNKEKQASNTANNNNNANAGSCNSSSSNQNSTSYRSSTRYVTNQRVANSSTENAGSLNKRVDRLKTENRDAIVLSPQRRSFVGGCQAPTSSVNNNSSSGIGSGATSSAHMPSSLASGGVSKAQIRDMRSCSPTGASSGHARYSSGGSSDTGCVVSSSSSQTTMPTISSATIYNSRRHPPAPLHDASSTAVRSSSSRGGGFGGYSSRIENWRDRSSRNFTDTYTNRSQPRRWAPPSSTDNRSASSSDGYTSYKQSNYSNSKLPEWATEGPADVHDVIELCGFEDDRTPSQKDDESSERVKQIETVSSWYDTKSTVTDTATYKTAAQASHETSPNDLAKSNASLNSKLGVASTASSSLMTETLTDLSNLTFSENLDNIIGVPKGSRLFRFFQKDVGESKANTLASAVDSAPKMTTCETAAPLTSLLASAAAAAKSADTSSSQQQQQGAVPAGAVSLEELEAMLCRKPKPQPAESEIMKTESTSARKQLLLQDLFKSAATGQPSSDQIGLIENQMSATTSNMLPAPDGLAIPSHLATSRPAKFPSGKTNPLSDPGQQQKLMDALNKLKLEQMTPVEEQQLQQQQSSSLANSSENRKSGIFATPTNVLPPTQSMTQAATAAAAAQAMPPPHLPYLINQQLLAQQAAAAADIIRMVQQQQQQRQQAIRLQQLQLMQQMTSVPRLPVPGKPLTQEEYQQMLALTLFQQQQQAAVQRAAAAAAAAAGNPSAVDILRQRALLAAAALPNAAALQQAQLFNQFRQPNFSQPPPDAPRNLLNVGGLGGAVGPSAAATAATANMNAAAAKSLMEEIERLQKSQQQQQPPQ